VRHHRDLAERAFAVGGELEIAAGHPVHLAVVELEQAAGVVAFEHGRGVAGADADPEIKKAGR
jgi:hypothetical protein